MPKKAPVLTCTEEDRVTLDRWIRSRTIEARLVERAKIIMKSIQGQRVLPIAKNLKIRVTIQRKYFKFCLTWILL